MIHILISTEQNCLGRKATNAFATPDQRGIDLRRNPVHTFAPPALPRRTVLPVLREPRRAVPEEHVIGIWLREQLPERSFALHGGGRVRVIDPGVRNLHDGPDFLAATVVIDDRLCRGAIEVHTREGDWERHGHHQDVRYDDVVLHVCLYAEGCRQPRPPVVVLATELRAPLRTAWSEVIARRYPFPCADPSRAPAPAVAAAMIVLSAAERFARKRETFLERLPLIAENPDDAAAWRQLMYEAVARATGYGGNQEETEKLARRLPLAEVAALSPAARERRFMQTAGMEPGKPGDALFERHVWRNARVMPHNRIGQRLRWFSAWCVCLENPAWWRSCFALLRSGERQPEAFRPLFLAPEGKLAPGSDRIAEIMVNVLAPLIHLYAIERGDRALAKAASLMYFSTQHAAQNRHTRAAARALQLPCGDTQHQQGMTELHSRFCTQDRCAECLCHPAR